ncbi:MAG: RNase adapter RapZ [Clostridia bacterium]|nr:RNase adapter RapZ [Clostridia bacterium]
MKVVIITGLSGAGKTRAADWFEDVGYYVVDNMPPALIKNFIELTENSNEAVEKAAFVADIRGGAFFKDLESVLKELKGRKDIECTLVYLEASDETLIRRYNETRRHHPLSESATSKEIIDRERESLAKLASMADYIIDTSNLKISQFNNKMNQTFSDIYSERRFNINIISFGFKYGLPIESDIVLDMRFIPNPYYVPSLKGLTGNNKKIQDYVMKYEISQQFCDNFESFLKLTIPHYIKEGKYSLNIAFGCTGGHHRSVCMANIMAKRLEDEGYRVTLNHRDI